MSKIRLEELEMRLLLTGMNLPPCSALSPSPSADSGYSSPQGPGSHANPIPPGGGGGESARAQFPSQNPHFAEIPANGNPVLETGGESQRVANLAASPAPPTTTAPLGVASLASPVPESALSRIASGVETQTSLFSTALNPLLESGGDILAAVPELPPLVMGRSAPETVPGIVGNPLFLDTTSLAQLVASPSSPTFAIGTEASGQSTIPIQNRLLLPVSAYSLAATVPFGALSSSAQQPVPPGLSPFASEQPQAVPLAPPLFAPQDVPALSLPALELSALKAGLFQLLPVLSHQGQQALSLPAVEFSALESALLRFLEEMGQTTSQLTGSGEGSTLRMWAFAAVGAGAACLIAYRQQRQTARLCASDTPLLPGCFLDEEG